MKNCNNKYNVSMDLFGIKVLYFLIVSIYSSTIYGKKDFLNEYL